MTRETVLSNARVVEILRTVDDPEIGLNIVDLGFIYEVSSEPGLISIRMALTSDACPMRETILNWVRAALGRETGQAVLIDNASSPPWSPDRVNPKVWLPGEDSTPI